MIAFADSEAQRTKIFSFRYEVIAGEQGIATDPSINHSARTIVDPADDTGRLLAAWDGEVLTGSVRTNLLRDGPAEPYSTLLGLAALPDDQRLRVSVTSRLLVSTRWRGTPLCIRLAQACYRYCFAAGVAWDYILVRPALVPFYLRLGYELIGNGVQFTGVGQLTPLRLDLDPAYLRRAGSVLAAGVA